MMVYAVVALAAAVDVPVAWVDGGLLPGMMCAVVAVVQVEKELLGEITLMPALALV